MGDYMKTRKEMNDKAKTLLSELDKSQHTPTPWKLYGDYRIVGTKGQLIGSLIDSKLNPEERNANATYIVRAVNSFEKNEKELEFLRNCHEELLSALRAVRLRIQKGASILGSLEVVEKALAKAEGL